jgi:spectinomycin phosphotransferase
VRLAPSDLGQAQLADVLRHAWGLDVAALEYVAIGGGSHHWRALVQGGARLWLSVDDLFDKPFLGGMPSTVLAELQRAFQLARALVDDARLEFVVAPLPRRSGAILQQVGERYALAVYPFLDGATFAFGQALPDFERQQLLNCLIRLHAATPLVGAMARRVRIEVDNRYALEDSLRALDRPWSGGPLSEPARVLAAEHATAIRQVLVEFDHLVLQVAARNEPLVITHGEPHPGNVLARDGRLLLLDWDTVGLAPPERDLWWLASNDGGDEIARYASATGFRVSLSALRLYRLRWLLDDLVYCVRLLSAPHAETLESERALEGLARSVELATALSAQTG